MIDASVVRILQSLTGATSYKKLPVPSHWNSVDRPHVAILEWMDERVFPFFVSQPLTDSNELSVSDLEWVRDHTIVEVRYSDSDYRYYRRDGNVWTVVAQARDRFFVEYYAHGSSANPASLFDIGVSSPD